MQTCLSVTLGAERLTEVREFYGAKVPWLVRGYTEEYSEQQRGQSYFDLSHYGVVEIVGPDAADFMQRLSTADIRKLESQRLAPVCFLNGRSHPISWGWIAREGERFLYWTEPHTLSATLEYLEMMHFAEKLELRSADFPLFAVYGSTAPAAIASVEHPRIPGLTLYATQPSEGEHWTRRWMAGELALLGQKLFEYDRVQSSIPRLGEEVSPQALALEAGLGWMIAENKGCFPGQEVVERIRSYGRVNRSLTAVSVEGLTAAQVTLPLAIASEGKTAVQLVTLIDAPQAELPVIGLAYVGRQFLDHEAPFELDGGATLRIGVNPR